MPDDNTSYSLAVSFPDQSQTFVLGFEAGMLWQLMVKDEPEINITTNTLNREVISRMANSMRYTLYVEPTSIEGWDHTRLVKDVYSGNVKPKKGMSSILRVIK